MIIITIVVITAIRKTNTAIRKTNTTIILTITISSNVIGELAALFFINHSVKS